MSARVRILLPVLTLVVVALGVLFAEGASSHIVREFSLRSPNQEPVVVLGPGAQVCEGPVGAGRTFTGVEIFGGSALGTSRVRVDVERSSTHASLASGLLQTRRTGEWDVKLNRSVPAHILVRVCVTGVLNTFSLMGSQAANPHVQMGGKQKGNEFSLSLTSRHSLLSSLSLAFGRASLWKLSWVGSWTFWLLAAALLGTFGVAIVAVATATAEDDDAD